MESTWIPFKSYYLFEGGNFHVEFIISTWKSNVQEEGVHFKQQQSEGETQRRPGSSPGHNQ
eukprot:scaffold7751_cov229-Ochromonas_danica.AAC.2